MGWLLLRPKVCWWRAKRPARLDGRTFVSPLYNSFLVVLPHGISYISTVWETIQCMESPSATLGSATVVINKAKAARASMSRFTVVLFSKEFVRALWPLTMAIKLLLFKAVC